MRPSNTYWTTESAQPLFVAKAPRRVAIVTGANRGIGLEVVHQLAELGYLAVLGSRDFAKGEVAHSCLPVVAC